MVLFTMTLSDPNPYRQITRKWYEMELYVHCSSGLIGTVTVRVSRSTSITDLILTRAVSEIAELFVFVCVDCYSKRHRLSTVSNVFGVLCFSVLWKPLWRRRRCLATTTSWCPWLPCMRLWIRQVGRLQAAEFVEALAHRCLTRQLTVLYLVHHLRPAPFNTRTCNRRINHGLLNGSRTARELRMCFLVQFKISWDFT